MDKFNGMGDIIGNSYGEIDLVWMEDGQIKFDNSGREYNPGELTKEETKNLYYAMWKHYAEEERKMRDEFPPFTSQLNETPLPPHIHNAKS